MRNAVLLFVLLTTSPTFGSSLFDESSILDITLSGPLSSLFKTKKDREELPFLLTVNDATIDVKVRLRGHSRTDACQFPPLRLNFTKKGPDGSVFEGEDKLKLVTHCRNGSERSQDTLLNEFTAYRIFNIISNRSYRVRLLRIHYEDTDGKQRKLEEAHYGFLIESDEALARRLGGTVAEVEAILFSTLDIQQTARLNVFQYLIGNTDWSLVTSIHETACCHNIDLLDVDELLVPIPYDFDLTALTKVRYRRTGLAAPTGRKYSGYCRTPSDELERAIEYIQPLGDEVLSTAREIPALDSDSRDRRTKFIADYFDEASDTTSLLAKFNRDCVGSR